MQVRQGLGRPVLMQRETVCCRVLGQKLPHTYVPCRDGQAREQRRGERTSMYSLFPGLVGVGLLESILVSWEQKT